MPATWNRARISQTIKRLFAPAILRFKHQLRKPPDAAHQESELRSRLKAAPPVFIYQMGKVGSTSIYESLRRTYPGAVIHGHSFGPYDPNFSVRVLYDYYSAHRPQLRIITLIREPVSRNISAFFQNFKRDTGVTIEDCRWPISEIRQRFLDNYPHEVPLIWFDNNLHRHFGLNVYDYPFPAAGHLQIENTSAELLIMRHDLNDRLKQDLIASFVGDAQFTLQSHNLASDKAYADLYNQFRQLKLPLEHLYYLVSSRYVHHFFYSDIRQILKTWSDSPLPFE